MPSLAAISHTPPLSPEFYLRDTTEVARQLLGKGLYVKHGRQSLLVEIVEVEAYLAARDPASHAFRGITPRNRAMFERGGTCYVYLSYGINFCMNVATQEEGLGEAILFRAAAPLLGIDSLRKNRGETEDRNLLNGPGKLCQALGIDLRYNGFTFDREDFKLIDLGKTLPSKSIGASTRIGISKAKEDELRFYIKGSPWLSRKDKDRS